MKWDQIKKISPEKVKDFLMNERFIEVSSPRGYPDNIKLLDGEIGRMQVGKKMVRYIVQY